MKNNTQFNYKQTYLYKIHRLTTSLDTIFDKNLRQHANIGLSQFVLLLSLNQRQPTSQATVASLLGVSPSAISRQVEIARSNGWLEIKNGNQDRRLQLLKISDEGIKLTEKATQVLEERVFSIFYGEDVKSSLVGHIDMLQQNIDILNKK